MVEIIGDALGVPVVVPDERLKEYDVRPRIMLLNDTCHLGGEM